MRKNLAEKYFDVLSRRANHLAEQIHRDQSPSRLHRIKAELAALEWALRNLRDRKLRDDIIHEAVTWSQNYKTLQNLELMNANDATVDVAEKIIDATEHRLFEAVSKLEPPSCYSPVEYRDPDRKLPF